MNPNLTDAELLELWRMATLKRRLDKDTAGRLVCALIDEWMQEHPEGSHA